MLLYISLQHDVFATLLSGIQRFAFTHYRGWTRTSLSLENRLLENQLMLTLMKLEMKCKDADLAFRFDK